MKLDILVLAAHPDDAELACSGTIMSHIAMGKKVGIVDFTRGEMGTRGTAETRLEESAAASKIMGLSVRENLELPDCFFENSKEHQLVVIAAIRKYRPEIVLCNAIDDRHPDHGRAAKLASDACFYSGLKKVITFHDSLEQKEWRPKAVYHYIQDRYINPDFVIDISNYIDRKMEVIKAFKTQFYDPNSKEPQTYISTELFLDSIKARALDLGKVIGAKYGEGFTVERYIGVQNLFDLK